MNTKYEITLTYKASKDDYFGKESSTKRKVCCGSIEDVKLYIKQNQTAEIQTGFGEFRTYYLNTYKITKVTEETISIENNAN